MPDEPVRVTAESAPAAGVKPGLPELVERAGGAARFAWKARESQTSMISRGKKARHPRTRR